MTEENKQEQPKVNGVPSTMRPCLPTPIFPGIRQRRTTTCPEPQSPQATSPMTCRRRIWKSNAYHGHNRAVHPDSGWTAHVFWTL